MILKKMTFLFLMMALIPATVIIASGGHKSGAAGKTAKVSDPWTTGNLLKPGALAKTLSGKQKNNVVIIHTGPAQLFKLEHIPGAIAVGQTAEASGADALRKTLNDISNDKEIVLYCGCCPWRHCPNIRPAFTIARQMGFKKVKVLNLPTTFKMDWVDKDYPVEKGK